MSRLADEFRRHRPDWHQHPVELERSWQWLEEHGFDLETSAGYYLVASRDEGSQLAFTAGLSLKGWLEPQDAGWSQVLPIAEADGDGSMIALWRDGGATRVVFLGSEGDAAIVGDDPRELLALVAIGYDEVSSITLGSAPEEPLDVEAFRGWVTTTYGIEVEDAWPGLADDDFTAWMAAQHGEEPSGSESVPSDSPGAQVTGDLVPLLALLGTPDGAEAVSLVGDLLGVELGKKLRSSTRALSKCGVAVESARSGIETIWIDLNNYPRSEALIDGISRSSTREQVVSVLGEPESAGSAWVRYVVGGRYVHLEFDNDRVVSRVTTMTDAP